MFGLEPGRHLGAERKGNKFLVKLSEQPFSRNSPNSQFVVNSGKSWRTGLASGQVAEGVTSKESDEKQHSRCSCLNGCLG